MIRTLSIAAVLATGLSASAFAASDTAAPAADAAAVAAHTAQLTNDANANQVRKLLYAQGYTNVTNLSRGEDGRWVGSGVKDGKTVGIAIVLPKQGAGAPATN
jgi:hypothetical protein